MIQTIVSQADLYPGVPSRSLLRASCCSCRSCTPGSQSNVADGPIRPSPGFGIRCELFGQRAHSLAQFVGFFDDERPVEPSQDRRDPVKPLNSPTRSYPPGFPGDRLDGGDRSGHPHPHHPLAALDRAAARSPAWTGCRAAPPTPAKPSEALPPGRSRRGGMGPRGSSRPPPIRPAPPAADCRGCRAPRPLPAKPSATTPSAGAS